MQIDRFYSSGMHNEHCVVVIVVVAITAAAIVIALRMTDI